MNLLKKVLNVLKGKEIKNSNANVDDYSFGGKKFESAGLLYKEIAMKKLLSKDVRKAVKNNYLYIHDLDNYATGNHNCLQINFKRLLSEGFTTRNGDVRPPQSISTAMQQVAVIMQCQSQVQFGGCASMHIDYDLAPFVKKSFVKHYRDGLEYVAKYPGVDYEIEFMLKNIQDYHIDDPEFDAYSHEAYDYAIEMLCREGRQSAQGLYHNLNTLESRAGSQLPFTSINFGRDTSIEGRFVTKWLLLASIDGIGKFHRTPIFPISIFQLKKGVNTDKGDPNYDLYQLALQSTSKRLYPNYVNCDCPNANEDENDPDTYMSTMGCRTMLGYDRHGLGNKKIGRGNISPVTIVLPKLGIQYGICRKTRFKPDLKGFMTALDRTLVLAEKALIERFNYIKTQSPKSAPFMYKNGTAEGAKDCVDDTYEMIKHGTQAIGFIGLAETLQALFGKNQLDNNACKYGLDIVKRIYEFTKKASERNNLNFSCYFTPAESSCYTIMKALQKEFGKIPNVTENEYLTNSIHIPVWEKVSVFKKIDIESKFTKYGTAGCITYVEFDSKIKDNLKAIDKTIKYALEKDIPYLAINFPIDTCLNCGYTDEIPNNCPKCNSDMIERLARVTGYLSTDVSHFNKGKQQEVSMRYKHTKKGGF